jgi:hypothetical protein
MYRGIRIVLIALALVLVAGTALAARFVPRTADHAPESSWTSSRRLASTM